MSPQPPGPEQDDVVDILPREGFLEVRHRGTYSEREYKKFIARSIKACLEHGLSLLLVDISALAGFHPTPTERYEMGDLASKLGQGLARIAIFGTPQQLETQFSSLVARNRGLNVRPFTDRAEALRWLLEPEKS